jgi:hypothetical protein
VASAVGKLKGSKSDDAEPSGLKALLSKANRSKRRQRKEQEERSLDEVRRGRSVGERGTLADDGKPASRSASRGSRGSQRSLNSQLTYDSDDGK